MRIYKYRDLSNSEMLVRIPRIILHGEVWCSAPGPLNDPDEFRFTCDFRPTASTITHLAQLLMDFREYSAGDALFTASEIIESQRLEAISSPIITDISDSSRASIGVTCFGKTATNETLWRRYGGDGNGVCIGFEIFNVDILRSLHKVDYVDYRLIHIDLILQSAFDDAAAASCYKKILTTKTRGWNPEEEIRLLSKSPNIPLQLTDARVCEVVLGNRLSPSSAQEISRLAARCTDSPEVGSFAA